ncbi:unnamed protein product, partial [Lampetra planeri]
MVLASKLSSPVSFQQDKNFHQSFASWVKQGQSNQSSALTEHRVAHPQATLPPPSQSQVQQTAIVSMQQVSAVPVPAVQVHMQGLPVSSVVATMRPAQPRHQSQAHTQPPGQ